MRRLTAVLAARPLWMRLRGRHGERGGIAVATALLIPVFLGAAALAVDTTAMWAARQQVHNGADAAVLAVAMDCAAGACGDIKATSERYFFANDEAAKLADLKAGSGWIYVNGRQVRTTSTWLVDHFFGAAVGIPTGELSVESTAAWAPAVRSTSDLAFAISWCTYKAAIDNSPVNSQSRPTTISLTTSVTSQCNGPVNGTVTGGTAWTTPNAGNACGNTANTQADLTVGTRAAGCGSSYLSGLSGTTIDLPVWDAVGGSGTAQTYRVHGWAAFRVTGVANAGSTSTSSPPTITGYFVYQPHQVDITAVPTVSAPDLGSRAVYLTDPKTWTGPTCRNGATSC